VDLGGVTGIQLTPIGSTATVEPPR